jgi:hypothetical protein
MVSTISFIQANLQHNIAASRIFTRTISGKGIDMSLIQEPWYHDNCIRGLNIPGYTLYPTGGKDRPRACILARNVDIWVLPGLCCRDLVAVLVKYMEAGAERRLVVCSAYLPYDSRNPPPSKELEELVRYCENKNLYLIVGCDFNEHHTAWGSTNCNGRGEALMGFLNYSNLESLTQGNEHTLCSGGRQEVIDINLGFHGLLDSITGWEVSLEPSLSDHRHILYMLRGINWVSYREDLKRRLERGTEMSMENEAGLGLAVHGVQQALISAYEDSCPVRPLGKAKIL